MFREHCPHLNQRSKEQELAGTNPAVRDCSHRRNPSLLACAGPTGAFGRRTAKFGANDPVDRPHTDGSRGDSAVSGSSRWISSSLLEAPNRFGPPAFYTLHVWAWKGNPCAFVNWHPYVNCSQFNSPEAK